MQFRPIVLMGTILFSGTFSVHAALNTVTSSNVSVKWNGQPHLKFASNPKNNNGLSEDAVFRVITTALQRWKEASGGVVGFDYWQGTDVGTYEPNSFYNGLSSIYFTSRSNDPSTQKLSPYILGLTQVWYSPDSGNILETDVALNDQYFQFTDDVRDTSGFGNGNIPGSSRRVYLGNVITHELGHTLGLTHSAGLQTTMLFMESPQQAFLSCDEQSGIRALYPFAAAQRSSIHGKIVADGTGAAVFGAHVVAVSQRRGAVLGTAITNNQGQYVLNGLEAGTYYLMTEPYYAGVQSLPPYYAQSNSNFCSGQNFVRTMLENSGQPTAISISAGSSIDAPTLVAKCSAGSAGTRTARVGENVANGVRTIVDGSLIGEQGGFGATDRLNSGGTKQYILKNIEGTVEVSTLGYSLYSPVQLSLSLQDASGSTVNFEASVPVFKGDSGFTNYDARLVARGLNRGDYTLVVTGASLSSSAFPAGSVAVDSTPFFVITGSLNQAEAPLAGEMPVNARCEVSDNFGGYRSPSSTPERSSTQTGGQSENKGKGLFGFCGTVAAIAAGNSSSGGNSGDGGVSGGMSSAEFTGGVVGWFLPWIFMGFTAIALRRNRFATSIR